MSGTEPAEGTLPAPLAEIVEDFTALSAPDRLQLLLEFSDELPDPPARFADVQMEQVHECQSPLFLAVELADPSSDASAVHLFFKAPAEAPTTRGFAGILHAGLDGLSAAQILAVPDDMPMRIGLSETVSPLRMRGMVAMLSRIKRQIRALRLSA